MIYICPIFRCSRVSWRGKIGLKRHSSVVPAIVPVSFTEAQYNELKAHLEFYVKNILEQAPDKVFVLTGSAVLNRVVTIE